MALPREIPTAAKTWGLRLHTVTRRRAKDDGKQYHANVTRQMKDPDPDPQTGEVAERWPVSQFTVRAILERWGAGRYTVDWFDKGGKRIDGWKFDVAEPTAPAAARAVDDEDDELRAATTRLPQTQMEWLMWSQMREERAEARRRSEARDERDRLRQEADAAAQRDREFLKEVVNRAAPAAAAAPAVDISRELSLFERRMELNLQKHQLEVTQKLLNQQLADANNDDGASSLSEAANNAGVQAVEEIGEALPEIVAAGLGKLKRWMAANGQEPTRENMLGAIEALKAALSNGEEEQPNGAAHAEDD